ncbi:MAG: NTP transferase domain-containing protein, partial [Deltaproteobacteria bacterium]|nr:NTP transferase domain-containing protein [Deltaproteobacteria bacterium]
MISVILSGGAGSRLWPASRENHPKPFLRQPDGFSFLQKSFILASYLPEIEDIIVVTNKQLYYKTIEEFRNTKLYNSVNYILEPFGRNTAPAISLAALEIIREKSEDATVLVLTADHIILNINKFVESVNKAIEFAEKNKIVVFGIKPTYPAVSYGYIEKNEDNTVKRFIEKPALTAA